MKRWLGLLLCLTVVLALVCGSRLEAGDEQHAKARAAIKGLAERLKAELVSAIKSGGPVAALSVCKTVAPALAEQASQEHGLVVSRTALRIRNPDNAPDAWERKVLEEFVAKITAGSDPSTLEHAERTGEGAEKEFRYMKAIPMAAEPCLTCHGDNIEGSVRDAISNLYPEDRATGFKAGELRGAFTVRIKSP